MKTLLIQIAFIAGLSMASAQDYFAVVKTDNIVYNYPENTKFTLYHSDGVVRSIENGETVKVKGNYRLEADTYWSDTPDVITSDGGTLELFVISELWNKDTSEHHNDTTTYYEASNDPEKPRLEKKTITPSDEHPEKFNGLFVFSNAMVFSYINGVVRAYEDGEEIKIDGKYLVYGREDLLKISFNPNSAEMWYVFEKLKKED